MSRPTATVTVLPPVSPDPTRKRVRITVSPAGQYLVRGWFTKSASPTGTTAAIGPASPGDAFFAATDALGIRDVEVSQEQAAYFYCNVAVLGLVASSSYPTLSVSPALYAFGAVELGSYEDAVFTVTNIGDAEVTVTAATSAPYSIIGYPAPVIPVGESADITVRYTPSSEGAQAGLVSFSDGADYSPERPVSGTGTAAAPAGSYIFYAPADSVLADDAAFELWADALTSGKTLSPYEGGVYTLSVAPPPNITNMVIAFPDTIRALNSVVQQSTGAQVRLSWINGYYSVMTLDGIDYRVYQNVTLFPWTNADTFTITL